MIPAVRVDVSGGVGFLTDTQQTQVPYALMLALNQTANDAQEAERYRMKQGLRLQRETFNLNGIYIDNRDRATKSKPSVIIQVQASRNYLDKLEEGGFKLPTSGRWIWKPDPDAFKGKVIPENMRPKALHFHTVGGNVIGEQRTFMLKTSYGAVVKQRVTSVGTRRDLRKLTLDNLKTGMGPHGKKEKYSLTRTEGVRTLYRLVDRVSVPVKLEFVETVSRTARDVFPGRFQEAMGEAMRSAR
jgi:hypothetical protein